jgi:hypothetical protein
MITLESDRLVFSFPELHKDARLDIAFQRTLRIPDDDRTYPLPPGLGRFPLRHVDDFGARVPEDWRPRGGVMLPMFQSEAMWLGFARLSDYPFAVKVATGKINAVDGKPWASGLAREPQNYLATPPQPWLDGYCVAKGVIRQFVAMPLGEGYTAEEQITGEAEHGGIQIVAYPMKQELYEEWRRRQEEESERIYPAAPRMAQARFSVAPAPGMGLAPGGRMRQHIYDDKHGLDAWDQAHGSRCFVAIANSLSWRAITGEAPPSLPPTARDYAKAKLPWFDYYADAPAVEGAGVLANLLSVVGMGKKKGETPLPENEPADASVVVPLGPGKPGPRPVREAMLE